jgi:multidrug efflux pump subunit AcrB
LPITLIVTLLASLLVAYIINPVFAVDFMKPHEEEDKHKSKVTKGFKITTVVFGVIALLAFIVGNIGLGSLTLTLYALYCLNQFVLHGVILKFQEKTWPNIQEKYSRVIGWTLTGTRPVWILVSTIGLFIFSIVLTGIRQPKVEFFPKGDPNFIFTYLALPIGTDQVYTDSITKLVEDRIYKVVGDSNPIVESVIANVAVGASNPQSFDFSTAPHLGKVTVAFVPFGERDGQSTVDYLDKIRDAVKGIPGAEITVEQEQGGPPTGKPINIEITGDNFAELTATSKDIKRYLDSLGIPGIEELKSDLQSNKPEIVVEIDRERANREGISTAIIGKELRDAIFGAEVSKFKDAKDDYPIQLRYAFDQRNNINALMNLKITFRDMNMGGMVRQVPLSSVATIKYGNTFGGIKRKNQRRMITISSNVLSGYNANEIVGKITNAIGRYQLPSGVIANMTGEQEEQAETGAFLGNAMLISFGLIFLILVTQFNSVSKPLIIFVEIFFSIIGVLLGLSIFNMTISVVMTGVGVIALAGIVVRNGILLVEFTDLLLEQGMEQRAAIIEAGKTRMTPVILTASATILGLIPLAVGFNIDFVSLFSHFEPHIHFGGDNVAFWGPLSWTMIFGLSFATFLTLILVPVMLFLSNNLKIKLNIPLVKKHKE